MSKINNNIKNRRLELGMTQEDLAKSVYTTKSTISKWESGAITPGVDMLKVIAKSLDTKLYNLIGEAIPTRVRIFDWIGRILIYAFAWIYWDTFIVGFAAVFGFAALAVGAIGGAGTWIAYIVMYSITEWGSGSSLIVIGILSIGPFLFAFWSLVSYTLLNISRYAANFSLKYFWRTHKRIPKVKKPQIKKWMIILVIVTFVIGAIFLSIGASLHPGELNFTFK